MMLYLMLEKYSICFSCSDLKSRNTTPAVRIGGGVEDERLDAGHCVEAGEDKHEGEPKEEHIQLFQLERKTLQRRRNICREICKEEEYMEQDIKLSTTTKHECVG